MARITADEKGPNKTAVAYSRKEAFYPAGEAAIPGLTLTGHVIARKRRRFDVKGGGYRYNISLHILTPTGVLMPERWCDLPKPTDMPDLNEHVTVPVTLVTYSTVKGSGFRLQWGPPGNTEDVED